MALKCPRLRANFEIVRAREISRMKRYLLPALYMSVGFVGAAALFSTAQGAGAPNLVTAYQQHMTAEHERMAARDRAFLEERLTRKNQSSSMGAPF